MLTNLKLAVGDERAAARDLSAEAAGPVPRHATRRARPLHRQGPRGDQADRHGRQGEEGVRLRAELPGEDRATTGKDFVEQLWARRKVGYLLDQIRVNGEKKELVDEVVALAKRYGITTPYTSYLVVPDGP